MRKGRAFSTPREQKIYNKFKRQIPKKANELLLRAYNIGLEGKSLGSNKDGAELAAYLAGRDSRKLGGLHKEKLI